jgi:hypothetical protein
MPGNPGALPGGPGGINFRSVRDSRTPASSDDGLEELGDEVIIAQETGAHAPQPRAQVTTDHPTVVISEPPGSEDRRHRGTVKISRRGRSEKTVVIRDRKQLDQMRKAISDRASAVRRKPGVETRTWYLLGAAALASLALGTLIAAVVDATTGVSSAPAPPTPVAQEFPSAAPAPAPAAPATVEAIDLDALPDPPAKPRRADSASRE